MMVPGMKWTAHHERMSAACDDMAGIKRAAGSRGRWYYAAMPVAIHDRSEEPTPRWEIPIHQSQSSWYLLIHYGICVRRE
jgi:hypothetical protein